MKNKLALLLFVCILLTIVFVEGVSADVTQWDIFDISFTADNNYAWSDFPLQATFTNSGTSIVVDGFWDGGRTWKVRFAPTLPGTWNWVTTSVDPGLDGQTGSIVANAPQLADINNNPNYKGHLRIADTGRYLEYADGTPFFIMADTIWAMTTDFCNIDNGDFENYVDDRKNNKFNTFLIHYIREDDGVSEPNEGGYAFPSNIDDTNDYSELNPVFYQYVDQRMQMIWDKGFVAAGHPTKWGKHMRATSVSNAKKVSRYLFARYFAYNVIWSVNGEYQYCYDISNPNWNTADMNSLANYFQTYNAYNHPVTTHPSSRTSNPAWPSGAKKQSSSGEFHNENWLDHNWLQTGQSEDRLRNIPLRVEQDYSLTPIKPVFHSEGWYEKSGGASAAQIRWQPWVAILMGAMGHGYGGNYETPLCGSPSKEGYSDMQWVYDFFTNIEWTKLKPHRDWILVDGSIPNEDYENSNQEPHAAAIPGELYVIFIPEDNDGQIIQITNLQDKQYYAKWYNPREGTYSDINNANPVNIDNDDDWQIPSRPSPADQDWVLKMEVIKSNWKFAVYGDTRSGYSAHGENIQGIINKIPNNERIIVFNTGDIVDHGYEDEWQIWLGIVDPLDINWNKINPPEYICAIGNHEVQASNWLDNWVQYLPAQTGLSAYIDIAAHSKGLYGSVKYDNTIFIWVDSQNLPNSQNNFLEATLQRASEDPEIRWKFVFFHHPGFACIDSERDVPKSWHDNYFLPYGVDVVFVSHHHYYERSCPIIDAQLESCDENNRGSVVYDPSGVVHIISGGGGAQTNTPACTSQCDQCPWLEKGSSSHHFLEVEVQYNSLNIKAWDTDNGGGSNPALIEHFTINKAGSTVETCQNQGYDCCDLDLCQGRHSSYDNDCPGKVCCDACVQGGFSPGEYIEAEDGEISSPMSILSDSGASGGSYLASGTRDQGSVSFAFDIDVAGEYIMESRVYASSTGTNSFFVGLDGESAIVNSKVFDVDTLSQYYWDNVSWRGTAPDSETPPDFDPKIWVLSQGPHTFTFYAREINARLDRIILRSRECHPADEDCSNSIETDELFAYIELWKQNSVSIGELIGAIGIWKEGC